MIFWVTFLLLSVVQLNGASLDPHFPVDPEETQLREITDNVRRVSGVVMGLAEYVLEIREEIRALRNDIAETKHAANNVTTAARTDYFSSPLRNPEEVRRQSLELADKVERLLAMEQSPEVDLAKEELKKTVEKNFLRMLAAILVTGPAHTQERSDDIFKLMKSVLNGELDFTPVVQRLPLILRDSETNQFVNLLITLRETERGSSTYRQLSEDNYRQNNNRVTGNQNNGVNANNNGQGTGGTQAGAQPAAPASTNQLPTINSILDAMTQTNQLINQIPTLIEGLQTVIESLEGLVG